MPGGAGPASLQVPMQPRPIPWRRVAALLRPIWRGTAAMVALSVAGVLIGLVPPLVLGVLVNALVERGDKHEAALLTVLIAAAVVGEAVLFILSDGLYARNASRLYRNLRVAMFAGARARTGGGSEVEGIASRFISDAETLERATLSLLDSGAMLGVKFVSALVALGSLEPWTLAVAGPAFAATWIVTRRAQGPTAAAAGRRQEELEAMTRSLSGELQRSDEQGAQLRFAAALERLLDAETRYGWLKALNLQGSGGLAKLGPIALVVAAAFAGTSHAGTLISIYLLAQRAFWGFDGVVDLSLGTQSVRGAVARCFELVDYGAPV